MKPLIKAVVCLFVGTIVAYIMYLVAIFAFVYLVAQWVKP